MTVSIGLHSQSTIKEDCVRFNTEKVKKIRVLTYRIEGSQDSVLLLAKQRKGLKEGRFEITYDSLGNILREEYYHQRKISKAFDYHYKDGKWVAKMGDTLFRKSYIRTDLEYFDNSTYAIYESYSPDYTNIDTTYFEDHYDGRMKKRYRVENGKRRFEYTQIFNEEGQVISAINGDQGIYSQTLYSYDVNGRIKTLLELRPIDKFRMELVYSYPNKVEVVTEKYVFNEERTLFQTSSTFNVKDELGNIIYTYFKSNDDPRRWKVREYQIEYRD